MWRMSASRREAPITSFNRKDLNSRRKLVQCNVLSLALYGAEIWTFRKVDQKYVENFEMRC